MNFLNYEIDEKLIKLSNKVESELLPIFEKYNKNALLCSAKVLKSFQTNRLSAMDFAEITGKT